MYRNRMLGAAFAGLAAVISLALLMGLVCIGDACGQELYVLGRPLSAWGAAAHLISFMAFLFAPRLPLALWTVCVVSAHGWFYATNFTPCLLCTMVLGLGYLVAALAFTVGPALRPHPVGLPIILGAFLIPVLAPGPPVPAVEAFTAPIITHQDNGWTDEQNSAVGGPIETLLTQSGETITVDLTTTPVVVFGADCKHCDRVLGAVADMTSRPVLAATRAEGVQEKLRSAGLNSEWYIVAKPMVVPSLIYWDGERKVATGASAVLSALNTVRKGG